MKLASPWLLLFVGCVGSTPQPDDVSTVTEGVSTVRTMTWNIALLGAVGSSEYEAVRQILMRLQPDVVVLNEIATEDLGPLQVLADDLGYDTVFVPDENPFGDWRNGWMSRLPVESLSAPTAAALARSEAANDLTRLPIVGTIQVPDTDLTLTVVGQHLKAGFDPIDQFRRAVDAQRTAQATDSSAPVLVMGDLNAQLDDMPESPPTWTRIPNGAPPSFVLGPDLQGRLSFGIPNDAFAPFLALGLTPLDALQLDGRTATRPVSERRIDWAIASEHLVDLVKHEVYNTLNEGMGGLRKPGPAPERDASERASDHLPIVVDVSFPL
jgi:endonuclease/exonuclease/phosphatase family metal-dependent hydrolase